MFAIFQGVKSLIALNSAWLLVLCDLIDGTRAVTKMTLITNVLPNEALFRRLVEIAEKYANRILVQDEVNSVTVRYSDVLVNMLHMRSQLYESLPSSVFDGKGMISPDEPYIFILAPATYDYILAAFTVLSVAGAIAPICE